MTLKQIIRNLKQTISNLKKAAISFENGEINVKTLLNKIIVEKNRYH